MITEPKAGLELWERTLIAFVACISPCINFDFGDTAVPRGL
jgi:hypothetical protein